MLVDKAMPGINEFNEYCILVNSNSDSSIDNKYLLEKVQNKEKIHYSHYLSYKKL